MKPLYAHVNDEDNLETVYYVHLSHQSLKCHSSVIKMTSRFCHLDSACMEVS